MPLLLLEAKEFQYEVVCQDGNSRNRSAVRRRARHAGGGLHACICRQHDG